MQQLKEWLIFLLEGMVDHTDSIQIDTTEDEMGVLFTIQVHPSDYGKIIGKNGIHATALRTIFRCAGAKLDIRAALKIDAPILKK